MSIQRREFLKTASVLTSGLMLTGISNGLTGCASSKVNAAVNNNFGLQLYTLREDLPKDPKGVLRQVASFGYKQLEGYEGPQGIYWGMKNTEFKQFIGELVPFNWRGWWDYGTGALGDMGCHMLEVAFRVLNLKYARDVQASVGTVYVDEFKRGYFPESCPPSSHVTLTFPKTNKTKGPVTVHWMDGGIQPERPAELGPNEVFGDGGNGTLFIGTKGKMMCGTYGQNPQLLPTSRTKTTTVKQKYARVKNGAEGHYAQWVEGCIAGYEKAELSSPFETAGPLTELLLMANLAIRGADLRVPRASGSGFSYPGRNIKLLWDNDKMKVTNFDEVNQFVKREYREGFKLQA